MPNEIRVNPPARSSARYSGVDRLGVGLGGDLGAGRQPELVLETAPSSATRSAGRQQGRRAAAEEHRLDRPAGRRRARVPASATSASASAPAYAAWEPPPPELGGGVGVEVAVAAAGRAVRDVDVEAERRAGQVGLGEGLRRQRSVGGDGFTVERDSWHASIVPYNSGSAQLRRADPLRHHGLYRGSVDVGQFAPTNPRAHSEVWTRTGGFSACSTSTTSRPLPRRSGRCRRTGGRGRCRPGVPDRRGRHGDQGRDVQPLAGDELAGHGAGLDDGDADADGRRATGASDSMKPSTANFAAQYASLNGCPTTPPTLVTVTRRPPVRAGAASPRASPRRRRSS